MILMRSKLPTGALTSPVFCSPINTPRSPPASPPNSPPTSPQPSPPSGPKNSQKTSPPSSPPASPKNSTSPDHDQQRNPSMILILISMILILMRLKLPIGAPTSPVPCSAINTPGSPPTSPKNSTLGS